MMTDDNKESPKSLDELDARLGDNIIDFDPIEGQNPPEEWEIPEPSELDFSEIAEISYNAVAFYKRLMWPKEDTPLYENLSDKDKEHLKLEVKQVMETAHDPNDQNIARIKYAQDAMRKLSEGYIYGKDETEGGGFEPPTSPEVVPWEFLPNNRKMPYFLFRDIALRLVRSVWNGR